jgi:hypothetical protein
VQKHAPEAPTAAWQEQARRFVAYCHDLLFSQAGQEALAYLHARGLTDDTIRRWQLGWHEKTRQRPSGRWGLRGKPVWLLRGVVIPWTVEGTIWHVKIRRFDDQGPLSEPGKKYAQVTQGRPTLFGLDRLTCPGGQCQGTGQRTAVICEAELDAVLLWQEAGDLVDVVAIGSKGAKVSLPVLAHLAGATRWLVALDNDADAEAHVWGEFSARVCRVHPPQGNDLTEYHQSGGDLRQWVQACLGHGPDPLGELERELDGMLERIRQCTDDTRLESLQATLETKLAEHQAVWEKAHSKEQARA